MRRGARYALCAAVGVVALLVLEILGGGVLTAAARGHGVSAAWTSLFLVVTAALAFLAALALNDALRERFPERPRSPDEGRGRGAAVRGFRADPDADHGEGDSAESERRETDDRGQRVP